jgi:hypothetical protein
LFAPVEVAKDTKTLIKTVSRESPM